MKSSHLRGTAVAIALTAFAAPALTPTPASAWWHHPWGWHAGWHRCCWARPVVVGRPFWVPAHWRAGYLVPGHWG